jgi:hypothetical protein
MPLLINREVVVSQAGDYALIFAPPETLRVAGRRPQRRVIVSTVVAETGLTIDTLKYVIDCGWSRTVETYQPWRATGLTTRPAPRSRVAQRRGRCGRLFPGEFYPLYSEAVFNALDADQQPEVVVGNSAVLFLALVAAQQRQKLALGLRPEFRVEDLGLLDPPPPEALAGAIRAARALGFLAAAAPPPAPAAAGATGLAALASAPLGAPAHLGAEAPPKGAEVYGLTPLGWVAARFPQLSMEATRVLLAGYVWGTAASDLLTAAAMMGRPLADLFARRRGPPGFGPPAGAAALAAAAPGYLWARGTGGAGASGAVASGAVASVEAAEAVCYRARLLLADDFAEAVLIFDAFLQVIEAAEGDPAAAAAWCAGAGLRYNTMLELAGARERLADEMVAAGLDPFRGAAARLAAAPPAGFAPALQRLKRCLFEGLRMNLLRFAPDHPAGPGYVTHYHAPSLRVRCPPLYTDAMADRLAEARVTARGGARPRWIVTDQLRLAAAPRGPADAAAPLLYSVETNLVCVLDGYLDFDPDLYERALD